MALESYTEGSNPHGDYTSKAGMPCTSWAQYHGLRERDLTHNGGLLLLGVAPLPVR